MDLNNGIDNKPRIRRGRRHFNDRSLVGDRNGDINDRKDSNITLNVRVKERENDFTKRGPLGNIFKDTPTTAIKSLFSKESNQNLKDTIKRPLTGLFRRPSSRANSNPGPKNENRTEIDVFVPETPVCRNERVITPALATPSFERVLHDVANVSSIKINQMLSVYQLGFINAKNASLAKLDNIDLSLLSRFLCPEEEVEDEKVFWTWDYLFAGVSTEMRDEWAQDEERDDYEDRNLIK